MALPVVFFVFGCRQFAVYLSSWRRGKGCWCFTGQSGHRQGAHHHHHHHGHRHGHHRHHHHHHHHHDRASAAQGGGGGHGGGDHEGESEEDLALRRRSSLALQERPAWPVSMRPTSRRVRATQAVNVSLYLAKIVLRLGLLGVMWHMAFHAPLTYVHVSINAIYPHSSPPFPILTPDTPHTPHTSIFSLGYLALLAAVPVAFIAARSFHHTSRQHFPKLFRCMSAFAGLVLCTLHIFCSQDVGGPVIEEYVGVGLQEHGTCVYVCV